MEGGRPARLCLHQVRFQYVGEEVVIAVPLALVIERNDEQILPLQHLQHLACRLPAP